MYQASLTLSSRNKKTGPMPVSTVTADTCPSACPLKSGGCYAKAGPIQIHWSAVTAKLKGVPWDKFCSQVAALPEGQVWRHAQAGDLPGDGEHIDGPALAKLVHANHGRRGFGYSHYDPSVGLNATWLRLANGYGFTINLSANTLAHADELLKADCGPVVTLLPKEQIENTETPAGAKVVVCPAYTHEGTTCLSCRLCQKASRNVIVGFPIHGASHKRASQSTIEWSKNVATQQV